MELQRIVIPMLTFQMQLKIYHWQTNSFSRHKASDGLVSSIADQIDKFVETIQGARNIKVQLDDGVIQLQNMDDDGAVVFLTAFKGYLLNALPNMLRPNETDLLNQRDEILAVINQTLYLFTLR